MNQQATIPGSARIAFSNAISLSGRQWLGVIAFAVALVVFAPTLWDRYEGFALEPDYRIPHDLSEDYWLWERLAQLAAREYDTLVLGDSVVWGEYVKRHETLSHYLNQPAGKERFANLGLGGAHPVALTGLLRHYGGAIAKRNVVLQCNPLWLTSPAADLQDEKKVNEFNHPRLVPQFWPSIPAYKEEISPRLGILVEQRSEFSQWTRHVQHAYYGHADMPTWTLEHPYENPLMALTRGLPPSGNDLRWLQQPWYKDKPKQDHPWIDPQTSLQWPAFQEVVKLLQGRGNRVFVVVGPLNEHMLTPASLERYGKIKRFIAGWLADHQIPHVVPPALASEQYGDASHPLPAGYEALARRLDGEPTFPR